MRFLNSLDYGIIIGYFLILIVIGMCLKKMASASLDDYFLGGRKLPWWALGLSGMAAWLDMTGTMIITSFLYLLGPRGLYIELRGGVGLVLVLLMIWVGKWHRRSGVMTNAEWMAYRFGKDFWGHFARIACVIGTIISTVGILAYSLKGAGLFLAMFLPLSPLTCSIIMMVITTIYTMESGFYGVVATDIFQSLCIWIGVAFIVVIAAIKVAGVDLASVALAVTGNKDWMCTIPQWKTTMPPGYENYSLLTMVALFYLLKTMVQGSGIGTDAKYFGAKSDRDCGLLSFMCGNTLMLRWPLMMAFAVLGLFLVRDMFPDQSVLAQAAALIKQYVGSNVDKAQWAQLLSNIMNSRIHCPPELTEGLQKLLGSDWTSKLSMVSYEGTVDPERILPAVLLFNVPMGVRGLLLVALLAAAMSTFNAFINTATAYWTKDVYQAYVRPQAKNKELIYTSYIFGVLLVVAGFLMAYSTENINDIWGWLTSGLIAGLLVPTILRFYWWRFNGGGFAIGTMVGLIAAVIQRFYLPHMLEWWQFFYILGIGLISSIVGTYLTKPVDKDILEHFYKTTRPFGLWGRFKSILPPQVRAAMEREYRNDLLAVPFATAWQITLFLLPMQLIIHSFKAFWITLVIFIISLVGLYFFWYRHLSGDASAAK